MEISANRRNARSAKTLIALAMSLIALTVTAQAANADPFYTADELCKVTLVPTANTNEVGTTQTLTATIESTGVLNFLDDVAPDYTCVYPFQQRPVSTVAMNSDIPITFEATSGPNAGLTATVNSDSNGQATHSYSSSVTGTDIWRAVVNLPNGCFIDWNNVDYETNYDVPEGCLDEYNSRCWNGEYWYYCEEFVDNTTVANTVQIQSNSSSITWIQTVVEPQREPTVGIASSKRCHTANKFRIATSTANGIVSSMTLYVDGKKVKKVNGSSSSFTVNAAKYGPGSHSVKLTAKFTNGKTVTTTGTFNRCKARTVARRVTPRFTG